MQTSTQSVDVCITINNSAIQIIDKGRAYTICSAILTDSETTKKKKRSIYRTQNLYNIAYRIN